MAEGVFQNLVDTAGLGNKIAVDSAGTGAWHIGEVPHHGTQRILRKHGIAYSGRARQVTPQDMSPTTYIIAMDSDNVRNLVRRYGEHPQLHRLLDFAQNTKKKDVPDPYYTSNFDVVYNLILDGCQGLLAEIVQKEGV